MNWITWPFVDRFRDIGITVVRVGLGLMIMSHGWPKVAGGEARWKAIGGAMATVGIDAYPVFWGAVASFAEFFGGFLVVIGFATRPASALIAFTLAVAALNHMRDGADIVGASHPIETALGFLALLFVGPGAISIDSRLKGGG